ncbi:MAG: hypothetical protein KJS97_14205 [Alphaproteobacteria bacterium]|nr:hypothetical protein [Alphaproteobacteria bacterium]
MRRPPMDWLNAALWLAVLVALTVILAPPAWRCATGETRCFKVSLWATSIDPNAPPAPSPARPDR